MRTYEHLRIDDPALIPRERLNRSHSFIGKIESGERQLNVLEFWEVAEVLGVDPKKLVGKMVDSLPTHRQ